MRVKVGMSKKDRRGAVSLQLPIGVCAYYTEGQAAVLSVIYRVVKRSGMCHLSDERIAKLAGVSVTTVRLAVTLANDAEHIVATKYVGTNVITLDLQKWAAMDEIAIEKFNDILD